MLLFSPHPGGGEGAGENDALHPSRMARTDILQQKHPAPGLAQQMNLLQPQVLPERRQLVEPGLHIPEPLRFRPGPAASQLVVHDELTAVQLRQTVQDFEIVVGGAGASMKQQKRRFALCAPSHHAIAGLISQVGHTPLLNVHFEQPPRCFLSIRVFIKGISPKGKIPPAKPEFILLIKFRDSSCRSTIHAADAGSVQPSLTGAESSSENRITDAPGG